MSDAQPPGARVRIRGPELVRGRAHLLTHALRGDIGTVAHPDDDHKNRWLGLVWLIVRFDGCARFHRLMPEEVEITEG